MRLVRIGSVVGGMELAREIPSATPDSAPLVRRGVRLTRAMVDRLASRGIRALWIEDDLGDGIEPIYVLPDEVRRSTERAVDTCLSAARLTPVGTLLPPKAMAMLESAAAGMLDALSNCPEAALALDDLAGADSYTYSHSIRVATLGLLLGHRIARLDGWTDWQGRKRFDGLPGRMTEMATGLLIHDIGKIAVPVSVLNKPDALTPEEWSLVRTHPSVGASMLSVDRVSARTISVVRGHHERWDGQGYEQGRTGTEIHEFARIASVADVYDAVTADRPYKLATAPHVGVDVIRKGSGSQFDPSIVAHFSARRHALPGGLRGDAVGRRHRHRGVGRPRRARAAAAALASEIGNRRRGAHPDRRRRRRHDTPAGLSRATARSAGRLRQRATASGTLRRRR